MNFGALCLLKLETGSVSVHGYDPQGIFSVSAFIVSVIYLSRPLWFNVLESFASSAFGLAIITKSV